MERAPSQFGRRLLATLLLVSCVGCDQATKRFATVQLCGVPPRTYFHDTLRLEYALNPGGFLSIGDDLPPHFRFGFFIVTNIALLCGVGVVLLMPGMSVGDVCGLLVPVCRRGWEFDRQISQSRARDGFHLPAVRSFAYGHI